MHSLLRTQLRTARAPPSTLERSTVSMETGSGYLVMGSWSPPILSPYPGPLRLLLQVSRPSTCSPHSAVPLLPAPTHTSSVSFQHRWQPLLWVRGLPHAPRGPLSPPGWWVQPMDLH